MYALPLNDASPPTYKLLFNDKSPFNVVSPSTVKFPVKGKLPFASTPPKEDHT